MISKVKGKATNPWTRSEGALVGSFDSLFSKRFCIGFLRRTQNQTSICCLGPGPSQMFELRFSAASLETNGLEPWERMLRRSAEMV
jgi:hypothetical protein